MTEVRPWIIISQLMIDLRDGNDDGLTCGIALLRGAPWVSPLIRGVHTHMLNALYKCFQEYVRIANRGVSLRGMFLQEACFELLKGLALFYDER